MKTDDLISMLAANVAPVDPHIVSRRYSLALTAGVIGSLIWMSLRFGVRPDLATIVFDPIFWAKLAFPLALALAALHVVNRLGRPGVSVGKTSWIGLAAPIGIIWLATMLILYATPAETREAVVFGRSWRVCAYNITQLSVPTFIATFWAMKGLAPTRPRLAGAISGLLASAVATVVYSLHCPEMAVPFWAVWYLMGMLIPAAVGAMLGPRLLRW